MSQVDNVREGKLRVYRVSLKAESEQGQREQELSPEPGKQLMRKTSTAGERHGQ